MSSLYDIEQLKDRSLFPVIVRENMRFRDTDGNRHVNNSVYSTYFEIARIRTRRLHLQMEHHGTATVVARQTINFFQELTYPGVIDIGAAVVNIGHRSFTWGNAVFMDGICHATGEVTIVLIDTATKRATEIPPEFRDSLEQAQLRKTASPVILASDA